MGKDNLESQIKKKLANHGEYINKNALWASINEAPQRKRRLLPIWLLLLGLLIMLGISMFFIADQKGYKTEQSIAQLEIDQISKKQNLKKQNSKNNQNNSNVFDVSAIKNSTVHNKTDVNKIPSDTVIEVIAQNYNKDNNSQKLKNIPIKDKETKTLPKAGVINPQNLLLGVSTSKKDESITLSALKKGIQEDDSITEENLNKSSKTSLKEEKIYLNKISRLTTFVQRKSNQIDILLPIYSVQRPINTIDTAPLKNLSLYTHFGFGKYTRMLTTSGVPSTEFEIRSQEEQTLESINLAVGLKYHLNKKFYLKTGIDYTRYAEKYETSYSSIDSVFKQGIVNINTDYAGNTLETEGRIGGIQINKTTATYYNFINTINIYLSAGYDHYWSNFNLFYELGPIFNLNSNFNGHIATSQGIANSNPENIYKSSFGIQLQASTGASYILTKHTKLYLSASYRFRSKSITYDSYGINQRLSAAVLNIGIEKSF